MPSWNTPFTAPLDFTDMTSADGVLRMLWEAIEERWKATWGDGTGEVPPYLYNPFTDPGEPTASEFSSAKISAWQYLIVGMLQPESTFSHTDPAMDAVARWVDHRAALAGQPNVSFWTMPMLRTAAGLPTTKYYAYTNYHSPHLPPVIEEFPQYENTIWLRKRERTIDVLGSHTTIGSITTAPAERDDQLNPALVGQKARDKHWNRRWRCTAPGIWTLDATASPDILDNTQAPPNAVLEGYPSPATPGDCRTGDIIGGPLGIHVWEEMRAVLDRLRWTARGNVFGALRPQLTLTVTSYRGRGYSSGPSPAGPFTSKAAAIADFAAAWASSPPDEFTPPPATLANPTFALGHIVAYSWFTVVDITGTGYRWYWSIGERQSFNVYLSNFVAGMGKKVETYVIPLPLYLGYDDFGAGYTPEVLNLIETSGVETGTDYTGAVTIGQDAATPPVSATLPDTPPAGAGVAHDVGYSVVVYTILKWNVGAGSGGFKHCSATD